MSIFDITIDFSNVASIIIICTVILFAILGLVKGFVRSVIALICLAASLGLAFVFANPLIDFFYWTLRIDMIYEFEKLFASNEMLETAISGMNVDVPFLTSQIICFTVLFILAQIVFGVIAGVLYNVIGTVRPTLTDSILGMVLYTVIGVVVVMVVLAGLSVFPSNAVQGFIDSSSLASGLQELVLKILPIPN